MMMMKVLMMRSSLWVSRWWWKVDEAEVEV